MFKNIGARGRPSLTAIIARVAGVRPWAHIRVITDLLATSADLLVESVTARALKASRIVMRSTPAPRFDITWVGWIEKVSPRNTKKKVSSKNDTSAWKKLSC